MIIRQYRKPIVPKYANYDYVQVYDGNDRFVGWIKMYYRQENIKMRLIDVDEMNEELFYKEMGGKDTLITCETVFEMIKAQPIVFDCNEVIDKVIEILNRHNATFNAEANDEILKLKIGK